MTRFSCVMYRVLMYSHVRASACRSKIKKNLGSVYAKRERRIYVCISDIAPNKFIYTETLSLCVTLAITFVYPILGVNEQYRNTWSDVAATVADAVVGRKGPLILCG